MLNAKPKVKSFILNASTKNLWGAFEKHLHQLEKHSPLSIWKGTTKFKQKLNSCKPYMQSFLRLFILFFNLWHGNVQRGEVIKDGQHFQIITWNWTKGKINHTLTDVCDVLHCCTWVIYMLDTKQSSSSRYFTMIRFLMHKPFPQSEGTA